MTDSGQIKLNAIPYKYSMKILVVSEEKDVEIKNFSLLKKDETFYKTFNVRGFGIAWKINVKPGSDKTTAEIWCSAKHFPKKIRHSGVHGCIFSVRSKKSSIWLKDKEFYLEQNEVEQANYEMTSAKIKISHEMLDLATKNTLAIVVRFELYCSEPFFEHTEWKIMRRTDFLTEDHENAKNERSKNALKLLRSESYTDFTCKVGHRDFKIHRAIVASASRVFARMFDTNMKEAITSECVITNIDPDIFQHLLNYIYAGIIPDDLESIAQDLLDAAHFYEIESLERLCLWTLRGCLKVENAVELYRWASVYDFGDLKRRLLEIIREYNLMDQREKSSNQ